ncbi:integrase [Plantactinospora sp. GCM10030261]|uniref:integrase n=1 Tax=Plantactinospora sp. GCM10030261 TaxID=3273420 RepID=UPI0036192D07
MRSRLRRLHVDGRAYIWSARVGHVVGPDGLCHRCVRLRVWGAGRNGRALQVDLLSEAPPGPWGDPCATDGCFPEAADVRTVIEYGLRHGWQPDQLGGTHLLTADPPGEALTLPHFVATDLLRAADATAR